jgi:hypothetical protein
MKYLFLMAILFIAGCASSTKVVQVPVMVPCALTIPEKPIYPIRNLVTGDSPDVVIKAYVLTVKTQEAFSNELLARMKSCN